MRNYIFKREGGGGIEKKFRGITLKIREDITATHITRQEQSWLPSFAKTWWAVKQNPKAEAGRCQPFQWDSDLWAHRSKWYWSQSESDFFMQGALLHLESKWTQVNCVVCKDRRKLGLSKRQSMKVWQYFLRGGGGDMLWFINTFLWEIFAAEGLEL